MCYREECLRALVEFRSVVDAVRCAIEVQNGTVERNARVPPERRIEFRVGVHLGDVVEEADGDLMGDGVNIAARLEGICAPGAICLSEDAYRQVKGRLELAVHDLGDAAQEHRRADPGLFARGRRSPQSRSVAPAPSAEKSAPPRLSIVVLPFANIGGDPEQEYFVDGVTESLTTDLSRISGSFVIGRNTAFTYKGKAVDLKQIGRELNVRYVLEGSVQRGGKRMRVNVQLIDAGNGSHLWAERFDKPLADLFDMQDEIVARLAGALTSELVAAEARRAERASNPDLMDFYFQGLACFNKGGATGQCSAGARLPRTRARSRSRQRRRAHFDGGRGRGRGLSSICQRSRRGHGRRLRPKRSRPCRWPRTMRKGSTMFSGFLIHSPIALQRASPNLTTRLHSIEIGERPPP